jgi:hypothetical protein
MNKSILIAIGGLGLLMLQISCTKDRIFPPETDNPIIPPIDSVQLVINEVLGNTPTLTTDLGNVSDWMELYNPSDQPFEIKANEWFVSDNLSELDQFELPARVIPARGHLLIFCDDSNRVTSQIHTNFKISSTGDIITLSKKQGETLFLADSLTTGVQDPGLSNARIPDGGPTWQNNSNPTPGDSNQ